MGWEGDLFSAEAMHMITFTGAPGAAEQAAAPADHIPKQPTTAARYCQGRASILHREYSERQDKDGHHHRGVGRMWAQDVGTSNTGENDLIPVHSLRSGARQQRQLCVMRSDSPHAE